MSLRTLAQTLSAELGPAYHLRPDYNFVIPSREGVSLGRADAVIFSSAVPSIYTAAIGFRSETNGNGGGVGIERYAYLGAPLLVSEAEGSLALYRFSGISAEKLEDRQSPEWVRDRVLHHMESPQLRLPIAARDLLIQDTRNALASGISAMMARAKEDKNLDEPDAFLVAMASIRRVLLPDREVALPNRLRRLNTYVNALARQIDGRISFANVPAEAIAELYETFAVSKEDRQRRGVVYTPAWLARYVVDRLPSEAFFSGRALDATCGSGTFLVCFLERVVERAVSQGKAIDAALLQQSVIGIDSDPVAVEAARLSLDMFADAIGNMPAITWELHEGNATAAIVPAAEWLIGNLPFGYRTHQGRLDISSVILVHVSENDPSLRAVSLILPDSLAYSSSAAAARRLLRTEFDLQEVTRLPESVFASSNAATIVLSARKGKPTKSILVREVHARDLPSLRGGMSIAPSFYANFPSSVIDPWYFSPFSDEFERATAQGRPLADFAEIAGGLQLYGMAESPLRKPTAKPRRPVLIEPSTFSSWTPGSIGLLPSLTARRDEVRRSGPWEKFSEPKVIVRATTVTGTRDRLAAIPDTQGIWFTDKFVGIWPESDTLDIRGLAAYLQTRFVRAWFETNNPSRKLRVRVFPFLPVPRLPLTAWERAAALAPENYVVRAPKAGDFGGLFNGEQNNEKEWEWFNSVVDAALGLDTISSSRLSRWFTDDESDAHVRPVATQPQDRATIR